VISLQPSSMRFDIVRVSRRPEKFSMSLNFDRRSIGIRREKTQEFWDVPIDNLLQVIKSHKQSKCMKFRWRGRETKFDSYTFQSAVERERFYEAFWFIKNGFTRVRETLLLFIRFEFVLLFFFKINFFELFSLFFHSGGVIVTETTNNS
jgi:hypothetical protein